MLSWKLLYAGSSLSELALPFFIDWEQDDEERKTYLFENNLLSPHSKGALSLEYVAFAVKDFSTSYDLWKEWFGLEAGENYRDEEWNAEVRTLKLNGGNLLFAKPLGQGFVNEVIQNRGSSPFMVGLLGAKEKADIHLNGGIYRFL